MTSEMVTWASLLDQVHNLGAAYSKSIESTASYQEKTENMVLPYSSTPTLGMRKRSWDFTPHEVNKPLAGKRAFTGLRYCVIGAEKMRIVINLTAVAILIRRLGMTWKVFEPSNSLLQAEGNGMVVNSMKVPAVGTVLEFNRVEKRSYSMTQAELLIPGRNADALGFGRMRPWYRDDDSYISMGTSEEYTNIMLTYCSSYPRNEEPYDRVRSNPMIRCLADFVGLTARVMFIKGTQINRIPDPSPNS
jgi:hypothetical protein